MLGFRFFYFVWDFTIDNKIYHFALDITNFARRLFYYLKSMVLSTKLATGKKLWYLNKIKFSSTCSGLGNWHSWYFKTLQSVFLWHLSQHHSSFAFTLAVLLETRKRGTKQLSHLSVSD